MCVCFAAKHSYKILADIPQNLLEAKVCFVENTFGAVKTIMSNISQEDCLYIHLADAATAADILLWSIQLQYNHCFIVTVRTGTTRNIC